MENESLVYITDANQVEDYTEYLIEVHHGGFIWTVKHRYSEFKEMHDDLRLKHPVIEKSLLPPKKIFGKMSPAFIDKRRSELETYLQAILSKKYSHGLPRCLKQFLHFQFYEVETICQVLAETLYKVGDQTLMSGSSYIFSTLELWAITERFQSHKPKSDTDDPRYDFGHVLDFVQKLKHLHIKCPGGRIGTSNIHSEELSFDLGMFHVLRQLVVEGCSSEQIQCFINCRQTISSIGVHRSLNDLQCLLTGGYNIVDPSIAWRALITADFSDNNIAAIDSSVALLPGVEFMDLSKNKIIKIENLQVLTSLTFLDLSYNLINEFHSAHARIGNIKTLIMSHNRLKSLLGFDKLYSLETLNVSHNLITDITEVDHISKLPCLVKLNLTENAFTLDHDYRTTTLSKFGHRACEICLDDVTSSQKELDTAAVLYAILQSRKASVQVARSHFGSPQGKEISAPIKIARKKKAEENPILSAPGRFHWTPDRTRVQKQTDVHGVGRKASDELHRTKSVKPEDNFLFTDDEDSSPSKLAVLLPDSRHPDFSSAPLRHASDRSFATASDDDVPRVNETSGEHRIQSGEHFHEPVDDVSIAESIVVSADSSPIARPKKEKISSNPLLGDAVLSCSSEKREPATSDCLNVGVADSFPSQKPRPEMEDSAERDSARSPIPSFNEAGDLPLVTSLENDDDESFAICSSPQLMTDESNPEKREFESCPGEHEDLSRAVDNKETVSSPSSPVTECISPPKKTGHSRNIDEIQGLESSKILSETVVDDANDLELNISSESDATLFSVCEEQQLARLHSMSETTEDNRITVGSEYNKEIELVRSNQTEIVSKRAELSGIRDEIAQSSSEIPSCITTPADQLTTSENHVDMKREDVCDFVNGSTLAEADAREDTDGLLIEEDDKSQENEKSTSVITDAVAESECNDGSDVPLDASSSELGKLSSESREVALNQSSSPVFAEVLDDVVSEIVESPPGRPRACTAPNSLSSNRNLQTSVRRSSSYTFLNDDSDVPLMSSLVLKGEAQTEDDNEQEPLSNATKSSEMCNTATTVAYSSDTMSRSPKQSQLLPSFSDEEQDTSETFISSWGCEEFLRVAPSMNLSFSSPALDELSRISPKQIIEFASHTCQISSNEFLIYVTWSNVIFYSDPDTEIPCAVLLSNMALYFIFDKSPDLSQIPTETLDSAITLKTFGGKKNLSDLTHVKFPLHGRGDEKLRQIVVGLSGQSIRVTGSVPDQTATLVMRSFWLTKHFIRYLDMALNGLSEVSKTVFKLVESSSSLTDVSYTLPPSNVVFTLANEQAMMEFNLMSAERGVCVPNSASHPQLLLYCLVHCAAFGATKQPVSFVLTTEFCCLCIEDVVSYPLPSFSKTPPKNRRFRDLQVIRLSNIKYLCFDNFVSYDVTIVASDHDHSSPQEITWRLEFRDYAERENLRRKITSQYSVVCGQNLKNYIG